MELMLSFGLSETIATLLLLFSSFFLLRLFYDISKNRANPENQSQYFGVAKNPESLMEPNKEALESMNGLLKKANMSWDENE